MKGATILLVEDEALIALLLEKQLQKLGCTGVDKSATGEKALELARARAYDLVLMDIHLAGEMDGIEAAARLQEGALVPKVAFMTAFGDQGSREAAQKLSPLAFLEKPLSLETLAQLLEKLGLPAACP